jgi:GntR family transcriptional regulator
MEQFKRDPLYVQVHDRLLGMIQNGTYQVGTQLPAEVELSAMLGISRPTLREALRTLEQDGLVIRRHGLGTFVTRSEPLRSGLERLESLLSLAATQGLVTEVLDLKAEEMPADAVVAAHLRLPPGTLVTVVRRTIVVASSPISWMDDYVPLAHLRAADLDATFNGSVLDFLMQQRGVRVEKAASDITAVRANQVLAQRLHVALGTALVLIEETLVDAHGVPVGFSYNYSVPGRLGLRVIRS